MAGTSTVVLSDVCGNAQAQLTGNTTFYNLTLISSLGKKFMFPAGTNITVIGTLRLQGAPGNPIQLLSPSGQTININLAPGAQLVNADAQIGPGINITSPAPTAIPTLSEYALAILALMMAGMAFVLMPPSARIKR